MNVRPYKDPFPLDSIIRTWSDQQEAAFQSAGTSSLVSGKLLKQMENAGFKEVAVCDVHIPLGHFGEDEILKRLGGWNLVTMLEGIEAMTMRPWTRYLDYSDLEVRVTAAKVKNELKLGEEKACRLLCVGLQ